MKRASRSGSAAGTGRSRNLSCKATSSARSAHPQREPREGNVDGQFYVDHTCINCDTCRWMAPDSFTQVGRKSAVTAQPETRQQRIQAMQATLSCPTFSIHMRHKDAEELRAAQDGMPIPVEQCPGVFHCGYHSDKSFGATSYVVRSGGAHGNIMVDCPRYNPKLAKSLEAIGGVQLIFLTHIDDICDHDKWAQHFGAPRIMHANDVVPSISDIEVQLRGTGPWNLSGEQVAEGALDAGFQLVHTPGHTNGCVCLWHAAAKALFTGDHWAWSLRVGRQSIFPHVNRDGIAQQVASVRRLLAFDFEHVLPGHGRRFHVRGAEERERVVELTVEAELAAAGAR